MNGDAVSAEKWVGLQNHVDWTEKVKLLLPHITCSYSAHVWMLWVDFNIKLESCGSVSWVKCNQSWEEV